MILKNANSILDKGKQISYLLFDHYSDLNSNDRISFPNNNKDFNEFVPLFYSQFNAIYSLNDNIYKDKGYVDHNLTRFIGDVFGKRAVFIVSNFTLEFLTIIIVSVRSDELVAISDYFTFYEKRHLSNYKNYRYHTQKIPLQFKRYIPHTYMTDQELINNSYKLKQDYYRNIIFEYV